MLKLTTRISKRPAVFWSLSAFLLYFPLLVRAVPLNDLNNVAGNVGLAKYDTFSSILTMIVQLFLGLVFLVSALFIVISGYRYVTSAGNEEAVTKAKSGLTWAVVGLVVAILGWLIVNLVVSTVVSGNA